MPAIDLTHWPDVRGYGYTRFHRTRTLVTDPDSRKDEARSLIGSILSFGYALQWRTMTPDEAALLLAAKQIGGESAGLYWLDWIPRAEANLAIGTGTGAGELELPLRARMIGDTAGIAGLELRRDGLPLLVGSQWSLQFTDGAHYREHFVTIAAGANVNGAEYTATWSAGRRRRHVRLAHPDALRLEERPDGSRRWFGSAEFIETERIQ